MSGHRSVASASGGRRTRAVLSWVLVVLWALFMWSRSLYPGSESGSQSLYVVELVRGAFEAVGVTDVHLMEHIVRKTAHFCEYLVFGVLLANTRPLPQAPRGRHAARTAAQRPNLFVWPVFRLLLGVAVPSIDETIQRFVPGRTGQPSDVLLDCCGMLVGFGLCCLVHRIRIRRRVAE